VSQKKLRLHGWMFDIESGEIDALDHQSGGFLDLIEHPDVYAHAG
jgi:carbonic anhydrase